MKAVLSSIASEVLVTASWWVGWGLSPTLAESRKLADLLHGFAVQLPSNWTCKADGRVIWFTDGARFIVIRAAAQGQLHEVMRNWFWEHQALKTATGREEFAFRKHACGLIVLGDGLGFPYGLDPMAAVNFGQTGTNPDEYREVTVCLPGQNGVLLVTFLAPQKTARRDWLEMVDIVRTVEFVPPEKLVAWSVQTILDSETGGHWEPFTFPGELNTGARPSFWELNASRPSLSGRGSSCFVGTTFWFRAQCSKRSLAGVERRFSISTARVPSNRNRSFSPLSTTWKSWSSLYGNPRRVNPGQ